MAMSGGDVLWHNLVETSDDVDDDVNEDLDFGVDCDVWSRRVMAAWMMTCI